MNLLDLRAIAVPDDAEQAEPFGISFIAPAWNEGSICGLAKDFAANFKKISSEAA